METRDEEKLAPVRHAWREWISQNVKLLRKLPTTVLSKPRAWYFLPQTSCSDILSWASAEGEIRRNCLRLNGK